MFIGVIEIRITDNIQIILLPLLYALVMGLALFLAKPIKFVGSKQSKVAEGVMVLFIGVLIAKLAISSGQSISDIFNVGPALILQQFGIWALLSHCLLLYCWVLEERLLV